MADIGNRLEELAKKYIVVFTKTGISFHTHLAVGLYDSLPSHRYTDSPAITRTYDFKPFKPNRDRSAVCRFHRQHAASLAARGWHNWKWLQSRWNDIVVHGADLQHQLCCQQPTGVQLDPSDIVRLPCYCAFHVY